MHSIRNRNPGADGVRCVALFCVASLHFFLFTGYYETPVAGNRMYLMTLACCAFRVCVPLFLMLSGYLLGGKLPEKKYYVKLVRTLGIYFLASLCCAAYRLVWMKGADASVLSELIGILSYTTAPYAWYIQMYLGLFLLIPFLNVLYNALDSRERKQLLVLTLLVLTALPNVVNIFRFDELSWWLYPSEEQSYHQLIPQWWGSCYPITYYYLGRYLREYPLNWKRPALLLGNVLAVILAGSFNFYRSYGSWFVWGPWQDHGSALVAVQAVLVFSWFVQADYSRLGILGTVILSKVSDLSLGAFLVSWIFDDWIYSRLNAAVSQPLDRIFWFPVTVPAVLICATALSWVLDQVYRLFSRIPVKV